MKPRLLEFLMTLCLFSCSKAKSNDHQKTGVESGGAVPNIVNNLGGGAEPNIVNNPGGGSGPNDGRDKPTFVDKFLFKGDAFEKNYLRLKKFCESAGATLKNYSCSCASEQTVGKTVFFDGLKCQELESLDIRKNRSVVIGHPIFDWVRGRVSLINTGNEDHRWTSYLNSIPDFKIPLSMTDAPIHLYFGAFTEGKSDNYLANELGLLGSKKIYTYLLTPNDDSGVSKRQIYHLLDHDSLPSFFGAHDPHLRQNTQAALDNTNTASPTLRRILSVAMGNEVVAIKSQNSQESNAGCHENCEFTQDMELGQSQWKRAIKVYYGTRFSMVDEWCEPHLQLCGQVYYDYANSPSVILLTHSTVSLDGVTYKKTLFNRRMELLLSHSDTYKQSLDLSQVQNIRAHGVEGPAIGIMERTLPHRVELWQNYATIETNNDLIGPILNPTDNPLSILSNIFDIPNLDSDLVYAHGSTHASNVAQVLLFNDSPQRLLPGTHLYQMKNKNLEFIASSKDRPKNLRVVNISLIPSMETQDSCANTFGYTLEKDFPFLLVAAAGNDGAEVNKFFGTLQASESSSTRCPQGLEHAPNMLVVAGIEPSSYNLSPHSDRGLFYADLAANPIYINSNSIKYWGTSYAAPRVAREMAIIAHKYPGLTNPELRMVALLSTTHVPSLPVRSAGVLGTPENIELVAQRMSQLPQQERDQITAFIPEFLARKLAPEEDKEPKIQALKKSGVIRTNTLFSFQELRQLCERARLYILEKGNNNGNRFDYRNYIYNRHHQFFPDFLDDQGKESNWELCG